MNREKRVSVRFAAVGGQAVIADMRGIGAAGKESLDRVAASAAPAEAGLDHISSAAVRARQMLEQMAAKAAASAAQLRTNLSATTALQAQINRSTGVTSPTGMSAAEMLQQGQALDNLRAKFNPVYNVIRQHRNAVSEMRAAHLDGALSADELAAAISRSRQQSLLSIAAYKNQSNAIAQMSRQARMGTFRMQQMFYQVNDIGVSLAGGMNPFLVLAQQGTQIAQIYGFGNGGVSGIFKDLGGMIMKLPGWLKAAGLAAGVAAVAVRGIQSEINKTSDVTVTFGDTALAVWQVISEGIWRWIKPAVDMIAPWFKAAWDAVVLGVRVVGNAIINGIRIAVAGIALAIDAVPAMFERAFVLAKAAVLSAVADMVYAVYDGIKGMAETMNGAFGTNFSAPLSVMVAATGIKRTANDSRDFAEGLRERADFAGRFGPRARDIWASDPLGEFYNSVSERAQQNARNRIAAEDDGKGGKGGAAAKAEKDAVGDLVKQLQQELMVLRETDPIKKKMLEYSEQLTGATDKQRQQVLGLVTELDRAKYGWDAVGRSLKSFAEDSKRLGGEIGDSIVGSMKRGSEAVGQFVAKGKLDWRDMISSFAADMARLAAQEHVFGPLSGWLGNLIGGGTSDRLGDALAGAGLSPVAVPSFDGGGHTGYGPRSGGLDGKGGFLAMLHKGERVHDETKGGRGGAGGHVSVGVDPRNGNITAFVDGRIDARLGPAFQTFTSQALPHAIREHLSDPRAIG